MSLFVLTVGNLVFIACILLICDRFLILERKHIRYKYVISVCMVIIESLIEYCCKNIYLRGGVIIFVIVTILHVWYVEKYRKIIFMSIWLFLIVSVLCLIGDISVNVVFELFGWKINKLVDTIIIIFVFVFLYVVSAILKRKNNRGLKDIKTGYLICFTVITLIDALILSLMTIVTLDEIAYKNVILYSFIFVMGAIGTYVKLSMIIVLMVSRDMYKEKEEEVHKYLNQQQEHYAYLEERERETKKFRHDIRLQLFVLEGMRNDNNEEYNEHLEEIKERFERLRKKLSVYNDVVDAILYKFCDITDSKGIKLNVTGHMPQGCNIETYDLCAIFYNLLNNAVEALEKIDDDDKEISVDLSYIGEDIIIVVKNKFNGEMKNSNGQISTSKADEDWHGWGLQNVKDSVDKYDGIMDIDAKGNIFSVTILLKNISEEIGL